MKNAEFQKKTSIDCAIDAPIIVHPKSCNDPKASPVFVLDLGYLKKLSKNEPAPSIDKMFMESCKEEFGNDETSMRSLSDNYRIEIQHLSVLLGGTESQDWRFTDVYSAESLNRELESETLIEPFQFSFDNRIRFDFWQRCYFCLMVCYIK